MKNSFLKNLLKKSKINQDFLNFQTTVTEISDIVRQKTLL